MTVCHACDPPTKIINASLNRTTMITLDAEPHPAGLYVVAVVNGWARAHKIRPDQPPGVLSRHRLHHHRTAP